MPYTAKQIRLDRIMSDILLLPSGQFAGLISILKKDSPALEEKLLLCAGETEESFAIDVTELHPHTLVDIQWYANRCFQELRLKKMEDDLRHKYLPSKGCACYTCPGTQHHQADAVVLSKKVDCTVTDDEDYRETSRHTVQQHSNLYCLKYGNNSEESDSDSDGEVNDE